MPCNGNRVNWDFFQVAWSLAGRPRHRATNFSSAVPPRRNDRYRRQGHASHVAFRQHRLLPFGIIVIPCVVGFPGQSLSKTKTFPNRSLFARDVIDDRDGPMKYTDAQSASSITPLPLGRLMLTAGALLLAIACGCSRLRLPAVDPTGSCLFSPLPTTTSLALPGSAGEGGFCYDTLRKLKSHLTFGKHQQGAALGSPSFVFPEPAFAEPAAPPPCPTPAPLAAGIGNEPCVPSAACNGACQNGPRAVLLGSECEQPRRGHLPSQGKRGCILLSPQKVVVPVGGEVVLLSGICGTDGYLQMNEKLEWMLTPDSVGTFIQVGDDEPGLLTRLAGSKERPRKHDPSYAIGITSTKRTRITRGNTDNRDDVQLEKGQTWITLSSPSEGTSHVTVLAPDSECWDQRKATATIYWVDARTQFPGPQIVPKGQPVELTTRVTRSEGVLPARGWKVRYEIIQPELATFAGTDGASVVEATVDDSANATVQLLPRPDTSGTTAIRMQVIRPGGQSDNIPTLTLGSGETFVTWSAPQLAIRANAPLVATFDTFTPIELIVSNPGDQTATNVRVDVQLPTGTRVNSPDSFAQVLPNSVTWEIGDIPAQMELPLYLNLASRSPVRLGFVARGDGLAAEAIVQLDVFQPSLSIEVAPEQDRIETGQPATFNVDVTNTGDRPLQNLELRATGGQAMRHEGGGIAVAVPRQDGPLQPGQTWGAQVTFIPEDAGQRCVAFEVTADGGQRATDNSCVIVQNPVPRTPTLEAELVSPATRVAVGQTTFAQARVSNTGQAEARNVTVTMVYDPQLQLVEATEGADPTRVGQNIVTWTVPTIQPGQEVKLEGVFNVVARNPQARIAITAEGEQTPSISRDIFLELFDGSPPATPAAPPALPPQQPTPQIPGGRAPLQGPPPQALPPAPTGPQRSGRLQTQLNLRDNPVRVNDPIRYSLIIANDSNVTDEQVEVQFDLPRGVDVDRITPTTNPELGGLFQRNAGVISLPYIRTMDPGETVEYELVLRSNQPQTFDLNVRVRSQQLPGGVLATATTTVIN